MNQNKIQSKANSSRMTKANAVKRISALIEKAEEDYRWGGGETRDGTLKPGRIDWDKLRSDAADLVRAIDKPLAESVREVLAEADDILARDWPGATPVRKKIKALLKAKG